MTFEPLHIHHTALLKPCDVFSVCCASVTKVTRSRQTVKLTPYHRRPEGHLKARYTDVDPSNRTKPPTYLFSYQSCQTASEDKRNSVRPNLRRAPPRIPQIFFFPPRQPQLPPPPRLANQPRLSAAGEGVFTDQPKNPQEENDTKLQKSRKSLFCRQLHTSAARNRGVRRPGPAAIRPESRDSEGGIGG